MNDKDIRKILINYLLARQDSIKKELNTVIDYTQKISVCQNELEILRSSIKDSFINK